MALPFEFVNEIPWAVISFGGGGGRSELYLHLKRKALIGDTNTDIK